MSNNKKVAFITGASSGIGRTVALDLAKDHELILISRTKEALEKVAKEAIEINKDSKPLIFAIDVSNDEEVKNAVEQTIKEKGTISLVFNNAGIFKFGTTEVSAKDIKELLAINTEGAFNVLRHTVPILKEAKKGNIFNVTGALARKPISGFGAGGSSKSALVGFSESLFLELAPLGIKVTDLSPAHVNTPIFEKFGSQYPKDKMIQTEDIASSVRFILSLSPSAFIKSLHIDASLSISHN